MSPATHLNARPRFVLGPEAAASKPPPTTGVGPWSRAGPIDASPEVRQHLLACLSRGAKLRALSDTLRHGVPPSEAGLMNSSTSTPPFASMTRCDGRLSGSVVIST